MAGQRDGATSGWGMAWRRGDRSSWQMRNASGIELCPGPEGVAQIPIMKTISVTELHEHTADWVQAVRGGAVLITDGGNPVARLEPWPAGGGQTLRERRLRPGFARLVGRLGPKSAADDVTRFISEERDGR